jgi:hypothetical protein
VPSYQLGSGQAELLRGAALAVAARLGHWWGWNAWPLEPGARWYRRASRERAPRESAGAVVAAILEDLRAVGAVDALRRRYGERDGAWAHAVADRQGVGEQGRPDIRRIEDAACGLRWLEITRGSRLDLGRSGRSLVPQLPLTLLGADSADDGSGPVHTRLRPPQVAEDDTLPVRDVGHQILGRPHVTRNARLNEALIAQPAERRFTARARFGLA